MSAHRHSTLKHHFEQAQGLEGAHRARFIAELRAKDHELAAELVELLEADGTAGSDLWDAPLADLARRIGLGLSEGNTEPDLEAAALPATLGRYTLTAVLGRGGQGVVYRARQETPKREVAVKVLPSAVVSPGLSRRFAHEAEALALLAHEGIARIFDAGAEQLGGQRCSYIAMELVEGLRLDQHVRKRAPGLRDVLALVRDIARTVDYAHRRGVIHRDLKPGNIIVTPEGQAKVLDFGVARLVRPGGAMGPGHTLSGTGQQIVGTLAYMSPEQASGDASLIDVRSDVYALGAIAYELVCGTTPRDVKTLSIPAALRAIAETDVATPRTHVRDLPPEVEAIVLKALARRPEDRYQHASGLADDIERYLTGEAVLARNYTRIERARRFVRRNRLAVFAGVALTTALAGGIVATSWQASIARREREGARQEAQSARAATEMMRRILTAASPGEARGQEVTVREMLAAAEAELSADAKHLGEAGKDLYGLATALATLADTRYALGDYQLARTHAQRAMLLLDATPRAGSVASIDNRCTLVRTLIALDKRQEAREIAAQTQGLASALGPTSPGYFAARVATLAAGKPGTDDGTPAQRRATVEGYRALLAEMRKHLPENDPRIDSVRSDLAVDLEELGERQEAFRIACEIFASRVKRLGKDHPDTLLSLHNIAVYTGEIGKLNAAIGSLNTIVEARSRVLGADHPSTLLSRAARAKFLFRSGELIPALADAQNVFEARTRRLGPTHRATLDAMGMVATGLVQLKRLDEASVMVDSLLSRARDAYGPTDPASVQAITMAWDLAEAKGDRQGMIRHAQALIGTPFEGPVLEQMKAKGLDVPAKN
jgi:serine/threonine-protein kinase